MRDDLSILIQGPINEVSLSAIEDYSKFSKNIIISTWNLDENGAREIIEKYKNYCNIKLVSEQQPDYKKMISDGKLFGISNDTTFYWQILGLYLGVSNCDTKYIIRTRSDEYFKNLEPLINKFFTNGEKFTCGNIWFRPKSYKSLHIGDHLYITQTDLLNKSLTYLMNVFSGKFLNVNAVPQMSYMFGSTGGGFNSPEQVLAKALIISKINPKDTSELTKIYYDTNWDSNEICSENFDVIDINELSPIKWNWSHGGQFGNSFVYNPNNPTISNIKQY